MSSSVTSPVSPVSPNSDTFRSAQSWSSIVSYDIRTPRSRDEVIRAYSVQFFSESEEVQSGSIHPVELSQLLTGDRESELDAYAAKIDSAPDTTLRKLALEALGIRNFSRYLDASNHVRALCSAQPDESLTITEWREPEADQDRLTTYIDYIATSVSEEDSPNWAKFGEKMTRRRNFMQHRSPANGKLFECTILDYLSAKRLDSPALYPLVAECGAYNLTNLRAYLKTVAHPWRVLCHLDPNSLIQKTPRSTWRISDPIKPVDQARLLWEQLVWDPAADTESSSDGLGAPISAPPPPISAPPPGTLQNPQTELGSLGPVNPPIDIKQVGSKLWKAAFPKGFALNLWHLSDEEPVTFLENLVHAVHHARVNRDLHWVHMISHCLERYVYKYGLSSDRCSTVSPDQLATEVLEWRTLVAQTGIQGITRQVDKLLVKRLNKLATNSPGDVDNIAAALFNTMTDAQRDTIGRSFMRAAVRANASALLDRRSSQLRTGTELVLMHGFSHAAGSWTQLLIDSLQLSSDWSAKKSINRLNSIVKDEKNMEALLKQFTRFIDAGARTGFPHREAEDRGTVAIQIVDQFLISVTEKLQLSLTPFDTSHPLLPPKKLIDVIRILKPFASNRDAANDDIPLKWVINGVLVPAITQEINTLTTKSPWLKLKPGSRQLLALALDQHAAGSQLESSEEASSSATQRLNQVLNALGDPRSNAVAIWSTHIDDIPGNSSSHRSRSGG